MSINAVAVILYLSTEKQLRNGKLRYVHTVTA